MACSKLWLKPFGITLSNISQLSGSKWVWINGLLWLWRALKCNASPDRELACVLKKLQFFREWVELTLESIMGPRSLFPHGSPVQAWLSPHLPKWPGFSFGRELISSTGWVPAWVPTFITWKGDREVLSVSMPWSPWWPGTQGARHCC